MDIISSLKDRIETLPLPGKDAQAKMAHVGRKVFNVSPGPDSKEASVLMLLYPKAHEWHTVFMQRTSRFPNDKHKGQISFPGGQAEPFDTSHADTALREANEEVGVIREDVTVIGALTELYIPVSNFLVRPFVGYLEYEPTFKPDPNEVAGLIETPIDDILNWRNRKKTSITLPQGFKLNDVPYFDVKGNVVWGATSMILSEFVDVFETVL